MFKIKATSLYSTDPEQSTEWRFDLAPWSERNTEAFAGLHNKGKRIILIMDGPRPSQTSCMKWPKVP